MKVTYINSHYVEGVRTNTVVEISIEDAVKSTLNTCYSDGAIERLQELIENQRDMMAALIQRLADTDRISSHFVQQILKYDFTVED